MQSLRGLSRPGWLLVVLTSLCSLSCTGSEGLNPVQGKVLYKKQPLSGALITFHPSKTTDIKAIPAVGLTKEDGTFSLTTGQKDGALAGEYIVTIICTEVPTPGKNAFATGGAETQDRLAGAYADRTTSKLKIEIKKGANQLEPFDLK